jgi:hypothetical protein
MPIRIRVPYIHTLPVNEDVPRKELRGGKMLDYSVNHVKFGKGKIIEERGNYITVLFEGYEQPKLFLYPESFEKFLVFEDLDLQEHAMKDVTVLREKKEAEEARHLEQEKMEETHRREHSVLKRPAKARKAVKTL